mmetsp:Transcript_36150/g.106787  ORF Transcript_36150/g.106787 Transcript_36150/m.106787 type:complete len:83 (+) Transcript_36150:361-609(+)
MLTEGRGAPSIDSAEHASNRGQLLASALQHLQLAKDASEVVQVQAPHRTSCRVPCTSCRPASCYPCCSLHAACISCTLLEQG